jgi:hypothetical protein
MKFLSINKMLEKVISVIIYATLTCSWRCAAEKVTVERILDFAVFGQCSMNLKWFRDDQWTVDLTEKILVLQQYLRKDYSLTTIDNVTRRLPMVSPTVNLFEGCVLNIILGIVPNDEYGLSKFMVSNNYTYSSAPLSTYVLVPNTFKRMAKILFPIYTLLLLPVRVFYLLVPTLANDDINLYTHPYLLVCVQCRRGRALAVNSDLAYVSSLNFSSSWVRNNVQIVNPFHSGYDVTGCDHGPWRDLSESHMNICNYYYAFMDVLVRSVEPNLTLSTTYESDFADNRFSGHLRKGYLSDPQFDDAASALFLDVAIGGVYFCDCNPKSQQEMLRAWVTPFRISVWLFLMLTFLLVSFTIRAKLKIGKRYAKNNKYSDLVGPFMIVAGLYFRQEGTKIGSKVLLLITSFCIGVILSLYENTVTSELVVPPAKFEHNLSTQLMVAKSKVIYTGEESPSSPNLVELKLEAQKWNINYKKDQLQLKNNWYENSSPLENGTSLSYFVFHSAVESDLLLRKLIIENNKCHCYIVKHGFRKREIYIRFQLFLRNKFALVSNILRESGIFYFFTENYRKFENNILLINLRRGLEENKYHSDFFRTEERGMDLIKLENLHFLLVIYGGMGLIAVNIFTLMEMDWLTLWLYCKGLVLKYLHAIRSVNYVSLVNRLCTFRIKRRALKA